MTFRTFRSDAPLIAASTLFAIGGFVALRISDSSTRLTVLGALAGTAVLAAAIRFARRRPAAGDPTTLTISETGVHRTGARGYRVDVRWDDIAEVAAITTDHGVFEEDCFVALRNTAEHRIIIPHTLAVKSGLMAELQRRLDGFDSAAFSAALNCRADRVFRLWLSPNPGKLIAG